MDPGFLLQLGNGLVLCWLGTEWMLTGRQPQHGWRVMMTAFGLWAALNALALLASLDSLLSLEGSSLQTFQRIAAQAAFWLTAPLVLPMAALDRALQSSVGAAGLHSLLAAALVAVLPTSRALRNGTPLSELARNPLTVGGFLAGWMALWLALVLLGFEEWAEGGLPVRVAVVVGAYYALCYVDVKQRRPDLNAHDFLAHFLAASAKTLLLLPAATVAVATAFLVLVTLLEAVGLPTAWLNWPIYYGALYGPSCLVYFFTKRQVMSSKILPL